MVKVNGRRCWKETGRRGLQERVTLEPGARKAFTRRARDEGESHERDHLRVAASKQSARYYEQHPVNLPPNATMQVHAAGAFERLSDCYTFSALQLIAVSASRSAWRCASHYAPSAGLPQFTTSASLRRGNREATALSAPRSSIRHTLHRFYRLCGHLLVYCESPNHVYLSLPLA